MQTSIVELRNIEIGEKSFVGACAQVNRSVALGDIVVGVLEKPLHYPP